MRHAALVTIALLSAAADLHAQGSRVVVGDRVRVDAPTLRVRHLNGLVVGTGDTIVVARNGRITRLPVDAVTRLDVYRGRSRRRGAWRGAIAGTGFGLALGLMSAGYSERCPPEGGECNPPWSRGKIAGYTAGFTAFGTLCGTGSGALIGAAQWERVRGGRVSMTAVPGGIGLRVALGR